MILPTTISCALTHSLIVVPMYIVEYDQVLQVTILLLICYLVIGRKQTTVSLTIDTTKNRSLVRRMSSTYG